MGGFAFPQLQYPHIDTPTEVATKQATLGDILAQKQQREQLVQDNAMKLQQQRQAMADQQALTNHIRNVTAAGGTRDQAMATMDTVGGVSPTGAAKFRDLDAQIKDRYASADKTTLANQLEQNNMVSADLLPIRTMTDPGMKAAQWAKAVQNAQAKGYIQPNDPSIPATYPGDQAYEAAMAHLQGTKAYIDYGINSQKAADEHVAATNTAQTHNLTTAGQLLPPSIDWSDPEASQATWGAYRSKLTPAQQALVPEQGSPEAEKQVRNQAMTVEQQATNQRAQAQLQHAQAELAAQGITPDDITAATDPKASPESRRAAADAIVKRKGDAAAQQEIAKQLGVVTALLGGTASPTSGQTSGAVAPPPTTSGTVQIPPQAPGQPGITQLAAQNNNPGNLRFAGQPGAKPGAGGYAAFGSPEAGYAALQNQIAIDTQKGLTLQQYITKYAPPSENDTAGYLARAAQATGASPTTPLSQIDANKLAQFQAKQESSSTVNGAPPAANARNEAVLADAVKAGKISQATANEIKAVAGGAPYWTDRAGPLGMANEVKKQLLAQYAPDYVPTTATNPATAERLAKDKAIQDAFRDSGYDWNKVAENVRAGKYDKFAGDIADHAEKMGKLPAPLQTKIISADTTKQQVQAAIDGIREVVKAHPELVGNAAKHPINALIRKGETLVGGEPADVGAVDAILETAMALQPGQHNFRSIGALSDFKKSVGIDPRTGKADGSRGWLANPDKVIAGLQGIADFNDNLKKNILRTAGRGAAQEPANNSVPTPTSQAEYNALPRGAKFKKPNDQTVYTKQ